MKKQSLQTDCVIEFDAPELMITLLNRQAQKHGWPLHEEIAECITQTLGKEEVMRDVFERFSFELDFIQNTH